MLGGKGFSFFVYSSILGKYHTKTDKKEDLTKKQEIHLISTDKGHQNEIIARK